MMSSINSIFQYLIYRQLSIDHRLQTKLGRTVRRLRSRTGTTGTLATNMTKKLKDIVREAQANQENTGSEDQAEESDKSTNEIWDRSEQELEKTVNITPPPKNTDETVDLRRFLM